MLSLLANEINPTVLADDPAPSLLANFGTFASHSSTSSQINSSTSSQINSSTSSQINSSTSSQINSTSTSAAWLHLESALFYFSHVIPHISYQYLAHLVDYLTTLLSPLCFLDHLILILKIFDAIASRISHDFFSVIPEESIRRLFAVALEAHANPLSPDADPIEQPRTIIMQLLLQFLEHVIRSIGTPAFCRFLIDTPEMLRFLAIAPLSKSLFATILDSPDGWYTLMPLLPTHLPLEDPTSLTFFHLFPGFDQAGLTSCSS
jgi:hypothetical protein